MSAQSAKKKRLGSRRRAPNQNETSKPDESHAMDGTFIAEHHVPEEHTESLNARDNLDYIQSETQHPPSPELSGSRRKLGSSRRHKGRHAATESYHAPREEVEDETMEKETAVTKQTPHAIRPERQEALSQGSDEMSATHDRYLDSASTPTTTNYPDADLEGLTPKGVNLQTDRGDNEVLSDSSTLVETVQEGIDKSDSEEVKESEHLVGISEIDQQLTDQSKFKEKLPNVCSVIEEEGEERDVTEFCRQDGNSHLMSESHMQVSPKPEISPTENTEVERSDEQTAISSPKKEPSTDEEQNAHFNLYVVRGANQSEDAVNKQHEQEMMHDIDNPSESVKKNSEMVSGNLTDQTEVSDTNQSELTEERTDGSPTNQDISDAGNKHGGLSETNSVVSEDIESSIPSAPEEEFPTSEGQNEISDSPEVKDDHHSEDAVNKLHEQEVKPTEDQEMLQIDNPSESVIHDASENSEMISGNLTDQTEVSDTNQSELTEERTDGSPTNHEHPTEENNSEASEHKNEDYHVYDTKEPQISDPGEVSEIEGRVEDDMKLSTEPTAHQEKDGLFSEMEESESSLQTLQSGINAPLEAQNDTSFNPIGNRRKLGSSRRNRGRQHVKDSAAESHHEPTEDVGDTRDNEPLETTEMSLIERGVQEEFDTDQTEDVSDQGKEKAHDGSVVGIDLHSSSTADQQTIDQSNFREMPDGLSETNSVVSEDIESSIPSAPEEEFPTNEGQNEISDSPEVKDDHHSEDAVNKLHEQEVKPTEDQEMLQIDNPSESVIHDASENSEMVSGNLTDQTEVSDTNQSELTEERTDGSPNNHEHPTEENFEASEQKNEDYHVYDTKEPQIRDPGQVSETEGRVEDDVKPSTEPTAHREKDGLFSEMEESESSLQTLQSGINAPLDSQNDTSFNPIGHRRKLGSSRRNRGRQHVKDSAAESHHEPTEDVGDTRDNEPLETTEMFLIERGVQEESMLEGRDTFDTVQTEDGSDQGKDDANVGTQETDEDAWFRQDGLSETNSLVSEDMESSIPSAPEEEFPTNEGQNEISDLSEVKDDHHSEDAVNKLHEQEVKPTEDQEMLLIDNPSESVIHDASENSEMVSGNPTDQTEVSDTNQSELTEKRTDGSPTNHEHPTEENFEASEQKNEDYHVYDTKEPQIRDPGQVSETEGRVEDDMKPSTEQTAHQEKDGLFDDTSFNPVGNRRKLGSSRRNRGRQHVKDSAAESHHEPTEDVGDTRDDEPLETTEMSLIERGVQEKSMLEGRDTFDTVQTEDGSDQGKEKAHDDTVVGVDLHPSSTVDQQTIEQSNFREMPDGPSETNSLVSEDIESSIPSAPEEEFPTNEGQNEISDSPEVKDDHHSEDAVNKLHEQEVKPTEDQEMLQIDNPSESVIHDASENSEMVSGNLTDQTEVSDTNQSELTEKRTDGSPTNHEHPIEENFEASEQKNEDYHVYDTKEPQIRDPGEVSETEGRVEDDMKPSTEPTAHQEKDGLFSEMEESESSLQTQQSGINAPLDSQNDTGFNPIGNRRKLGSSRRNRGRQHVKDSAAESHHEPTEDAGDTRDNEALETTEMSLIERGVQEESMLEGRDTFDTDQTEDGSDQGQEKAHDGTVVGIDLHSSSTADQQTMDQSNFREMPDGLSETKSLVSEDMESSIPSAPEEEFPTNEGQNEIPELPEVKDDHHSEDAVNKLHEQEVKPTEDQETLQIDDPSESVIHDASENSEMVSGNLTDQTEVSDTNQSELTEERTDGSPTNHEHPTEENFEALEQKNEDYHVYDTKEPQIRDPGEVSETEGRVEDDMKPSTEPTAHQEKDGLVSEMEESESSLQTLQSGINAPLDSQNDTGFNPIGNRRKLGSSRRNRGRQHVKDSAAESHHEPTEDFGDTRDNEPLETTEMSLISMETMLEGRDTFDTVQTEDGSDQVEDDAYTGTQERDEDTTLFRQDGLSETNSLVSEDIESSIPSEITSDKDSSRERTQPEYSVEPPEEEFPTNEGQNEISDSPEVKDDHHSEDAVNKLHEQEVQPTEDQETLQIDNPSESVIHDASENSEMVSGNLTDQTEVSDTNQSELTEKRTDGSPTNHDDKQDEHPIEENFEASEQKNEDYHVYDTKEPQIRDPGEVSEVEGRVEDDMKPSTEQTAHQEKDGLLSEMEESESSLQTLQSGINAPLDSQNDTSFNPIGHRRKLGSSRRNRGRQHVKDSAAESHHEPTEDVGDTRDNEPLETTEMSLIERGVQEESMLEGRDTFDTDQTEDVSDQGKDDANVGTQERDEDTLFRQTNYLVTESHGKSEDVESSISLEVGSENSSPREHTDVECSVEQAALSSSKEELSTNEEPTALPSEDAVNNVPDDSIKPTQIPQIDDSSIDDSESSLQTLQTENLDIQPLDKSQSIKEHSGFSPTGVRRKLGSSRRHKGRLHVEDAAKTPLRQEELKEESAGEMMSTVNDKENTEKMAKGDPGLSQNLMDDCTIATTGVTSSSRKDDFVRSDEEVNEEECKVMKDTETVSQPGCDTVQMDLIQSVEVSAAAGFNTSDVLEQEETSQVQNVDAVGDVTKQDDKTEAESSTSLQVYGLDEDGEDPAKKDNVSLEITHAGRLSSAPSDVGLEENVQAEPAADASEESGISSQQGIQTNMDDSENLQGRSKERRRKLGSTRRSLLNRTSETNTAETNMRSPDKMEVVEELTMAVTAEISQSENASLSPGDKEDIISKALPPEQSAFHNEVNPVKFVHVADVRDSDRDVSDDFTATEMQITSVSPGRNSINPSLYANTEDSTNTGITDGGFVLSSQSRQSDEERSVTPDRALKSAPVVSDVETVKSAERGGAGDEETSEQEQDDENEGAHSKHLEMNASPTLDPTNRRRKMGSSRRNLRPRSKQEDSHQKQEEDAKETHVGDVKSESFSPDESHQTSEETPVSQLVETEHQLTPSYRPSTPSTPPRLDSTPDSSPGGRRRKMGSHRKSHGHQNQENKTTGGDRITNERDVKTTEELRDTSPSLDKISEVDKSDKKPSSNISTTKLLKPVSEKTAEPASPVQRPYAEISLGQESQHKFPLGTSRSNAYNVMMVGDSCVGKTSFMKRAQSGKFSLDLPASVGLDSCMWTVVVDGKPVVLQLWDTAGQERFHSITRQMFYKAHAFVLMYDITSSQSFSAVSYWASCIQEGAAENVTILLVGNKSDRAERQVNTQKAEVLAKEYNFEFMECSAATGENVVHCLETVARMLSQKVDTRQESMVLHKEPQQRKSGCC